MLQELNHVNRIILGRFCRAFPRPRKITKRTTFARSLLFSLNEFEPFWAQIRAKSVLRVKEKHLSEPPQPHCRSCWWLKVASLGAAQSRSKRT